MRSTGKRRSPTRTRASEPDIDTSDPNAVALWEALRQLRQDIAKEQNVPPYVVFHDKTLKGMMARRPKRRAELLDVVGIGEAKLERFGDQFFELLDGWSDKQD